MLVIYEPLCHGLEHVPFNCGMLAAGLEISGGRVAFAAEKSHLAAVRESAPPEIVRAVDWREIALAPRRLAGFRARLPYERMTLRQVWRIAAETSATALVSTGITEPGLLALKSKLWLAPPPGPVGVVFHSVLERFLYSRKRRFFFHAAMPRRLRYLLLGETIHSETLQLVPRIAAHAFVLPHPLATGLVPRPFHLGSTRLVFAFLGLASESKGFPLFLRMAEEFTGEPASPAQFELIGSYAEEFRHRVHHLIDSSGGRFRAPRDTGVKIGRDLYQARTQQAAYVVLPYSAEHYRFTCSGAVFDAISAAKPLIALRTPLFENLFQQMGDIGCLCRDEAELLDAVRDIVAWPPCERYCRQRENLIRGRALFETANVARHLARALR